MFLCAFEPPDHVDHIHMPTVDWCQVSPSDMFLGSILCCLIQCCQLCGPQLTRCAADGDVYPLIRHCALEDPIASSICGTSRSQCLLQKCSTLTLQLCNMLCNISADTATWHATSPEPSASNNHTSVAPRYLETLLHAGAPAPLQAGVVQ